jgi:hypothetical protein
LRRAPIECPATIMRRPAPGFIFLLFRAPERPKTCDVPHVLKGE